MSPARTPDERAAQLAKLLAASLHVLLKTAQIHEPTNVALEAPVARVTDLLREMGRTEEAHLRLKGEHLYWGETRLRLDPDVLPSLLWLSEEMRKREIGGLLFRDAVRPEEVKRFAYLFIQFEPQVPEPYDAFAEQLRAAGISGIEVERYREELAPAAPAPQDLKQLAKDTYARAVSAVTDVIDDAKLGKVVGFRKAKRIVQSLVDLLFQDEPTLLGLTTLRCYDAYTHNHSVNVGILSLLLASRLGYSKKHLADMGLAFLFHDVGKVTIPLEVLNKPSGFTEEEWEIMRTHPVHGVKVLLKLKGLGDPMISMIVTAAFEHHMGYDGSGYPRLSTPWHQSLIGRIVSIADCYDAMTASRVYHRVPFSPDKTLQYMLERAGKAFDPTLLKIFINRIGIYPIGTLVLLDAGELAVVAQANPDPKQIDRPRVKIITDRAGNEIEGEVVDLAVRVAGHYPRSIVKTIDSTKYNIDVSRYFV